MDWISRLDPNGRWLVAFTRRYSADRPLRLAVVPTSHLGSYLRSGWIIVAEDPEPQRYTQDGKKDKP